MQSKIEQQEKLDDATVARVYEALPYGGFCVGDSIEVDIRFGDEGPSDDSWTRCEVTVSQEHINKAKTLLGPR